MLTLLLYQILYNHTFNIHTPRQIHPVPVAAPVAIAPFPQPEPAAPPAVHAEPVVAYLLPNHEDLEYEPLPHPQVMPPRDALLFIIFGLVAVTISWYLPH
jgi:hypothetical protein